RPALVHGAAAAVREVILRKPDAEPPRGIRIAERAAASDMTEGFRRSQRARVAAAPVTERAARAYLVDLVHLECLKLDRFLDAGLRQDPHAVELAPFGEHRVVAGEAASAEEAPGARDRRLLERALIEDFGDE